MKIIKRKDALKKRLKFYFSGKKCKRGHITKRLVSSYSCLECSKLYARSPKIKAYRKKMNPYTSKWRKEYNARNIDHVRKVREKWRKKNKVKLAAKQREYYRKNHKRMLEINARSRDRNREKLNARNREKYKNFTKKINACSHNTRVKRAKAQGTHAAEDIDQIYKKQKGKCIYCHIKVGEKYHKDHKMPLSKGGSNWPRNIQITCKSCNHRKSNKTHKEFLKSNYYKQLST